MLVKKLWTELITSNNLATIIDANVLAQAETLDGLMNTKFGITTQMKSYLQYINQHFFTSEGNNQWSGLYIIMSSFALGDERFKFELHDKLTKYLAFYNKFISDEGLAKRVTINRQYIDNASGNNNNNNVHSETPQIQLDNFEEGIKYASTMDKDTSNYQSSNIGNNAENKSEVTWDEAMTNLRTMLFNELIDYVTRIPNMIYNHYCTDTMPFFEQIKASCQYMKNMSDMVKLCM